MKKLFLAILIFPFFCTQSLAGNIIDRWATDAEVTAQTRDDVGITPSSISYLPAGGGGSNVTGPTAHSANYSVIWGTANSTNLLEGYPITAAGKALVADGNITAQRATMEAAKSGVNDDITSMTGLDDDGIPGSKVVAANVTTEGVSERGTDAEAVAGSAAAPHVTPANLVARETGTDIDRGGYYDTGLQNIPDLASKGPAYNFLDDSNDKIATGQDLITGWGAFSVVALAKSTGLADNSPTNAILASHGDGCGGLHAADPTTNTMHFKIFYDAGHFREVSVAFNTATDQDWHTWTGTVKTTGIGGNGYLYLYKDGKLVSIFSHSPVAALHASSTTFNIGGDGAGASWGGEIARVLVFNLGLTEPWVKVFSSGVSVPFKWNENATDKPGDTRNSGNFVVGAAYRILTRTDGNFTDAGAANNNVNTEFIATAVAAGVLDAGDTATRLGAVGIWEQSEIGETLWTDRSGNNYDGTVSGATTVNIPIISDRVYVGLQDFSNAEVKLPNSGTLPAACAVGQTYMDTNATSGQRFYLCESTNVWILQGDGGGAGGGSNVTGPVVHLGSYAPLWGAANSTNLLEGYLITDAGKNLAGDGNTTAQRATLGLVIGTDVEAHNTTLTDIADGNITEDLENTKYPWADNEIADDLTIAKLQLDHNVETLAAGKTLGITDKVIQKLDPDGTDRDVLLPPEASNSTDLVFFIYNMGGEVGEDLNIQDDAAVDILSIGYLQFALCTCDGTTWIVRCLACTGAGDVVDLRAKEENTSVIVTGQPVYISGATGVAYPNVGLADCDDSSKIRARGLASEDIIQNSTGYIRAKGLLEDVNSTKGSAVNPLSQDWTAGDQLWVSATAGGLTNVRPIGRSIKAGTALTVEGSDSKILVYPRENSIYTGAAAGEDIVRQMGDSAGANKISYTDFAGNEVANVNSDGNATYNKVTATESIMIGASPTPGWKGDVNSTLQKTIDGHIYLAATDSGNGTVDIDLWMKILVNDVLTARMHLDADGNNYFPGADMNIENGKVYKINNVQITSDAFSDVASIAMLDEGETITENWLNEAHPWADNETADDITLTNITQITTRPITSLTATNWRVFYSAGGGVPVELALDVNGTYLRSNGVDQAPSFGTPSGAGDMLKATYDADGDGDIDQAAGGLETDVSAYTGLIGLNTGAVSEVDTKSELEGMMGDVANLAEADGDDYTNVHNYGGAHVELPNNAGDVTVNATQNIAIDETQKQLAYYDGTREIAIPAIQVWQMAFDPGAWYDSDHEVWFVDLFADRFPDGVVITKWYVDANVADPNVEMNMNLMYCDAVAGGAFPGANPTLIDVMDTTTGNSSEADNSNMAANGVVATGKSIYLLFDADPEGTCTQLSVKIYYYIPES